MGNTKNAANWQFNTRAVRAGVQPTNEGEHTTPIFATSSFLFDSAEQAAARFSGEEPGNIYSRFSNPTTRVFDERLAALEEGKWGVAVSSGMAAVLSTCLATLQTGDHIIASRSLFGTITVLLDTYLTRLGIGVTFVTLSDLDDWQNAVRPNTKLLFLETPSNPLTELGDIAALADIAHTANALLVVDNCFCTPALQQPLNLGADLIVHSATKYLDGQGRSIGGAVIGRDAGLKEQLEKFVRTAGPTLSPFNAWLFIKGLETLSLRMQAQSANALRVATWLTERDSVAAVYYPGLSSHPQHALAKSQQRDFGAILSFELKGGQKAAWETINNTELLSITANLGDTRTTITHPFTTTHGRVNEAEKRKSGVTPGLVRLAVGLEDVGDIIDDLANAVL